jgi:nicotinamide-nucleotide amidase
MSRNAWSELKSLLGGPPPLTLAVAESLTCGHLQTRLGSISGASDFFLGGVTAYTLEQKVALLEVERAVAEPVDSVSLEVARQMARGACRRFGSDLAVATTGYAERPPAAVGDGPFAYWALAHRLGPNTWELRGGKVVCEKTARRADVQAIVAEAVLAELVEYLGALRTKRKVASDHVARDGAAHRKAKTPKGARALT